MEDFRDNQYFGTLKNIECFEILEVRDTLIIQQCNNSFQYFLNKFPNRIYARDLIEAFSMARNLEFFTGKYILLGVPLYITLKDRFGYKSSLDPMGKGVKRLGY